MLIGYNNQAIQYDREKIGYWQSDQLLEELNRKKRQLYTESCQQHYGDHPVPKRNHWAYIDGSDFTDEFLTGLQDFKIYKTSGLAPLTALPVKRIDQPGSLAERKAL